MTSDAIEALERLRHLFSEGPELLATLERQCCHGSLAEEEPAPEPEPTPAPAPAPKPEKTIELEDVRPVLAELARNGRRKDVQELLQKYGADRLSALDKAHYGTVLAEAKELARAPF